jgi:hypothetical protein
VLGRELEDECGDERFRDAADTEPVAGEHRPSGRREVGARRDAGDRTGLLGDEDGARDACPDERLSFLAQVRLLPRGG